MARGSIQKKGNNYYVRYRVDGKEKCKAAGPNKKRAEKMLTEIIGQLHRGDYQELPEVGFREFAVKWLKAKEADVRPKTSGGYKAHLKGKIIPYFGDRKLKTITTEDIEAFKASLIDEGKISLVTVGKYLLTLKMLLKTAVVWGYIGRNPAEHVKRPHAQKYEPEFLTISEVRELVLATPERFRPLIATAAYTGMRQGELLALRWDDVDFAKKRIYVKKMLQQGKFFDPKAPSSRRAIDIPEFLVKMLEEHQLRQAVDGPASELDLVFPNEAGKPMDRANLEVRIFKPALRLASLRASVNFHSLRHSYASMLIHQGANIKYVQKQLGHANIEQTLGTYSHLLPEAGREAIKKWRHSLRKLPKIRKPPRILREKCGKNRLSYLPPIPHQRYSPV